MSIVFDIGPLVRQLDDLQKKQIPFATARALSELAKDIAVFQQGVTNDAIDRPNDFTAKQSMYSTTADKRGPYTVKVGYKRKQAAYLAPLLGGERRSKPFEKRIDGQVKYVVAGKGLETGVNGYKLDNYGNVTEADLLELVDAKNTYGTAKRFFRGVPKGGAGHGFGDGVYARADDNNKIIPLLLFVTDAKYEKRIDFTAAQKRAVELWPQKFEEQLAKALATARK